MPGFPVTFMASPSQPSPMKGDDRNLVAVDQIQEGLSLEDQIYLFWERYKWHVVAAIVTIVAVVAGREVLAEMREAREAGVRAAFAEASAAGGARLMTFADENPGHPLAGIALLTRADELYSEGGYAEAGPLYTRAVEKLAGSPFQSRARLGGAMAQVRAGETDAGAAALQALVDNVAEFAGVRAEAAYHLATIAAERNDLERARALLDQAQNLDTFSFTWSRMALAFREAIETPLPPQADTPPPGIALPAPAATPEPAPAPAIEFRTPPTP